MKIGFLQFDVKHKDITSNLNYVSGALSTKQFDLIVLPELFTTGYLFNSKEELSRYSGNLNSSKSIDKLTQLAGSKDAYIVGTFPELADGEIFNTAVLIGPEGICGTQRKLHITKYEKSLFSPGNEINSFTVKGINIGIVTCFDSWFPEIFRILNQNNVDLICMPANFGGSKTLDIMKVRSMENNVHSIICNRTGRESIDGLDADFCGSSRIIDPGGNLLNPPQSGEDIFITEINPKHRKKNVMCDNFVEEWNKYEIKRK